MNLTRQPKIDPSKTYVVLDSFAGPHGPYREGQLVAGDDPALKQAPQMFVPSGLTDDAVRAARNALRFGAIAAATSTLPGIGTSSGQPINAGRTLRADELVVCTKRVPMTSANSASSALRKPVVVGTVLPKTDPVVRRLPKHFRPATADDLPPAAA